MPAFQLIPHDSTKESNVGTLVSTPALDPLDWGFVSRFATPGLIFGSLETLFTSKGSRLGPFDGPQFPHGGVTPVQPPRCTGNCGPSGGPAQWPHHPAAAVGHGGRGVGRSVAPGPRFPIPPPPVIHTYLYPITFDRTTNLRTPPRPKAVIFVIALSHIITAPPTSHSPRPYHHTELQKL